MPFYTQESFDVATDGYVNHNDPFFPSARGDENTSGANYGYSGSSSNFAIYYAYTTRGSAAYFIWRSFFEFNLIEP